MKKITNKKVVDYVVILFACFLQSFAIVCILKPSHLTVGGITGLALAIERIFSLDYSYVYWALCIMVLLAANFLLGIKEAKKIILLSTLYPLTLVLMSHIDYNFLAGTQDKLLICIYYGLFMGAGTGLIFKRGYSQGGTDTVAKILHRKWFSFLGISQLLLAIDTVIVLMSGFIFGQTVILYAIIMQVVYSKTVSIVIFGFGSSKVRMTILTTHIEKVGDFMKAKVDRRYSIEIIKGGYTRMEKEQIVSVCTLREAMMIKNYLMKIDENAFVNIVPVISAWGNGSGLRRINEDDD